MKPVLFVTAIGLLSGCTLGPDYQRPDLSTQLPANYRQVDANAVSTAANAATDRWWLSAGDPVLNELVAAALQRNLDLAGAEASIRQARAQFNIADSASQPQLNAVGRVGRNQFSRNSENFANIPFPHPITTFSDYRAGFDASWEIDLFGHQRRSVEAAQARLTGIQYQRQETELRVAAEVVRNVTDYRAWMAREANAQQIVSHARQVLDLMVLQQKAGLLSDTEVLDAQTSLHNAAASLPPMQAAAQAALMALTVLLDQSQEQVSAILQTDTGAAKDVRGLDAIGLPSDLLLRRPDLQDAERELAAASADIGVAVTDQYPRIDLLADAGLDSITPGKLGELASRYWNIGPQITMPLLSGSRLAAQVSAREAARDAALAHYKEAVLAAFADTETALIRYQREQQRLAEIGQTIQSQQQQLNYAQQRYQDGDTSQIPVLLARVQLAQTSDIQLASQQTLANNLTALYKALGGGTAQNTADIKPK